MLYILIKESYAMHSCLYNEYIIHILNARDVNSRTVFPIRSVGNHRKPVVLAEANKIRHSGQIVRVFYVLSRLFL